MSAMKRSLMLMGLWLIVTGLFVGVIARYRKKPAPLETLWSVPAFSFVGVTTQGSRTMSTNDLWGKPWIANFIFTRCGGPCPVMSVKMAVLQRLLPPDVKLVSFTVDPAYDTPKVLDAYARQYGADPERWIFAQMPKESLSKIVQDGFHLAVADRLKDPPQTRVLHSTHFVLIDGRGVARAYYDSEGGSIFERIRRDVERLRADKG